MTAIAMRQPLANADLISSQVDAALAAVATLSDRESLGTARIALDAAKEMARLHGIASELRFRLTRLELHIARRAGQLGITVKGVTATVAAYYADMTDAEIDELIATHQGKSAAASIMKSEKALTEYTAARARAAQLDTTGRLRVADAAETLTALVTAAQDEFYDRDQIHVSELTDYVAQLVGIPTFDEDVEVAGAEGLRLGLWDACRKSLASGELDDPRMEGLPRWITCLTSDGYRSDRDYARVPTAKATLRQLGDYIELIRRKARENIARADRLDEIRRSLMAVAEAAAVVDGDAAHNSMTVGEAAVLHLDLGDETRRSA
jgi:hypothetical protein